MFQFCRSKRETEDGGRNGNQRRRVIREVESVEISVLVHKKRLLPGGVVQKHGQLRESVETDSVSISEPDSDQVERSDGVRGEGAKCERDEEDAFVVGLDVVRHGCRHRLRNICSHRPGGQSRRRPRRRAILRHFRPLRLAFCLLLHRIRR